MSRLSHRFTKAKNSARKLLADKSGAIAIKIAVLLLPAAAGAGAAVDYSAVSNLETSLQNAVDSAVLAAGREFLDTMETKDLATLAEKHFRANFSNDLALGTPNFSLTIAPSDVSNEEGETIGFKITGVATADFQPVLSSVISTKAIGVDAQTKLDVVNKTIEAAFVFDASGSMTDADGFQKSTKAARDMLHNLKQFSLQISKISKGSAPFAKYALVPFAWGVNVGSDKQGEPWLDTNGLAANHHQYIDWKQSIPNANQQGSGWKSGSKYLSRFTLFDQIGESWTGCVDARAYPYNLDDTLASANTPDTLFVPMFAPDEPDKETGGEDSFDNNYLADFIDGKNSTISKNGSNSGNASKQLNRLTWSSKYNSDALHKNNKKNSLGPNRNCFDYEIYPLNDDFGRTNSKIAQLNNTFAASKTIGSGDDDGATNIQQGVVWGRRVLSSSEPFAQGRPDGDDTNKKIMILISDGINSYSNTSTTLQSEYGAYGYEMDSALEDSVAYPAGETMETMLDKATLQSCELAKAAGISIYVVGYDVVQNSSADMLLESCSGGNKQGQYYFKVDGTNIDDATDAILKHLIDIQLVG